MYLLFVLLLKRLSQSLEWFLYSLALQYTAFEEVEPNALSEDLSIMRLHLDSICQVHLVGYYHSCQLLSLILLLDAIKPLAEKVESVWVGSIIH